MLERHRFNYGDGGQISDRPPNDVNFMNTSRQSYMRDTGPQSINQYEDRYANENVGANYFEQPPLINEQAFTASIHPSKNNDA